MTNSDFIFFNNTELWAELFDILDEKIVKNSSLVCRLVSFASEFGLSGNIWQHWLTYELMTQENPFTLTCERRQITADAALFQLAAKDLDHFRELFTMDISGKFDEGFAAMLSYTAPYEGYHMTAAGKRIAALSKSLAEAQDIKEFTDRITACYSVYGVGIYGLYKAFRVSADGYDLRLIPITENADVCFDDLVGLEEQKKTLKANTEAFLKGLPANNVLLYGDSGTGKSTSVHALMHDYYEQGLRLVEISKQDRRFLPQVLAAVKKRNYHFIIFLDDLSFEENESDYKELKAMLEGALEERSDRVLIYATSNRRHLIRENYNDREEIREDMHTGDTVQEKLSLVSRFGVTIYFGAPTKKEFQQIVRELAKREGIAMPEEELLLEANKWELAHGGLSGRTAQQFIDYLLGRAL